MSVVWTRTSTCRSVMRGMGTSSSWTLPKPSGLMTRIIGLSSYSPAHPRPLQDRVVDPPRRHGVADEVDLRDAALERVVELIHRAVAHGQHNAVDALPGFCRLRVEAL